MVGPAVTAGSMGPGGGDGACVAMKGKQRGAAGARGGSSTALT